MADTTDGRRRRGFALALLVALTALLLAPAVAFAPPAVAAGQNCTAGTGGAGIIGCQEVPAGIAEVDRVEVLDALGNVRISYAWASDDSLPASFTCASPPAGVTCDVYTDGPGFSGYTGEQYSGQTYWKAFDSNWDSVAAPWATETIGDPVTPDGPHDVALNNTTGVTLDAAGTCATGTGLAGYSYGTPFQYAGGDPRSVFARWPAGDARMYADWGWVEADTAEQFCTGVPGARDGGTGAVYIISGLFHNADFWRTDNPEPYLPAGTYIAWNQEGGDVPGGVQCVLETQVGCDGWGTGGEGDFGAGETAGDCPFVNTSAHCLDWSRDRPVLTDPAPNSWTFGVKDYGYALATSAQYVVGWTCSGEDPVEGYASWHAMQNREFAVDCSDTSYVGNFYVLGDGGSLSEPDYADVVLWWGYYRPGAAVTGEWDGVTGSAGVCTGAGSCSTYNYAQPAPTTQPAPTYTAPAPAPEDGVTAPSSGCGFSFTDPTSWAGAAMCEVARMLRKVLDAIQSVLGFLRSIPSWFIPRGAVLEAKFGTVDTAFDNSPVGTLTGAVGSIAEPITSMESTVTSCSGPQFTVPIGQSKDITFSPLSTCPEVTQYILGILLPLERAFIYLGGFFVALRIVSRTVGLDSPDEREAARA